MLGDLEVAGELTVTSEWIVTGSVKCAECFVDETGSLSVARGLAARYVYAEGEVWIADDLKADVVWAEYEAGTLAVGRMLAAKVFIEGQHVVTYGALAAKKKIALESTDRDDCGKWFPKEAFDAGELSPGRLAKLVARGAFPG